MLSRQRYVVIGAVAIAVVSAMALSHALQWGWVQFGWDDPYLLGVRELTVTSVISYAAAIIAVLVVLKHQPTYMLANEVVDELAKVTWPPAVANLMVRRTACSSARVTRNMLSPWSCAGQAEIATPAELEYAKT